MYMISYMECGCSYENDVFKMCKYHYDEYIKNSSVKYAKPREQTQREKDISKEIGLDVVYDS